MSSSKNSSNHNHFLAQTTFYTYIHFIYTQTNKQINKQKHIHEYDDIAAPKVCVCVCVCTLLAPVKSLITRCKLLHIISE